MTEDFNQTRYSIDRQGPSAEGGRDGLRPILYLDVDDTLLRGRGNALVRAAPGAGEFVLWAREHFEVRWLTYWCRDGNMTAARAAELASYLGVPPRVIREIRGANFSGDEPHHRTGTKLDGIDWDEHRNGRPWAWVEDEYCMEAFGMYGVLQALGCADRWIHCNVSRNPWALTEVRSTLSARFLGVALQDCG
jgi:hypothetical protein